MNMSNKYIYKKLSDNGWTYCIVEAVLNPFVKVLELIRQRTRYLFFLHNLTTFWWKSSSGGSGCGCRSCCRSSSSLLFVVKLFARRHQAVGLIVSVSYPLWENPISKFSSPTMHLFLPGQLFYVCVARHWPLAEEVFSRFEQRIGLV